MKAITIKQPWGTPDVAAMVERETKGLFAQAYEQESAILVDGRLYHSTYFTCYGAATWRTFMDPSVSGHDAGRTRKDGAAFVAREAENG